MSISTDKKIHLYILIPDNYKSNRYRHTNFVASKNQSNQCNHMEKINHSYSFGSLKVNRVGYGSMQLTGRGVFGQVDNVDNAKIVLKAAVAGGVNFIDTAQSYGPGFSESLIAESLYPYPKDLVIATKGGFDRPGPGQWLPNGSPEKIRSDIEGSLKRLKVDTIDLWQLHRIDPNTSLKITLGPVVDAVRDGRIKNVGLSEVNIQQIEEARDILPIVSIQNMYNLGDRHWEKVLDYSTIEGLAFIPWYPLASGPLRFEKILNKIAMRHNATTAQIALAWLLKRAENIILIPGTSSPIHLNENLKASKIELSEEEFSSLRI